MTGAKRRARRPASGGGNPSVAAPGTTSWATQQLAEFLAAVSSRAEEPAAVRTAIERAAEALDADAGAVLSEQEAPQGEGERGQGEDGHGPDAKPDRSIRIEAAIGFAAGQVPEAQLLALAASDRGRLDVPGLGDSPALAVPIDDERLCWMLLARAGDEEFTAEDRSLLRGMARVLALTVRSLRLVAREREQSFRDSLTGLPNRALLVDRLRQALARAARARSQVAVLFLDLDTFKTVNDSLGHAAGDDLLVAVGRRLLGCIRPGDTAARFGGDEFVILLEDVRGEYVAAVAQRILDTLTEPFSVHGREVFVSASIGIAVGTEEADDLLRNADLALYRAKARGKSRHEVFQPEMHAAVVARLEMEGDLQRALQREEFTILYQPIVRLDGGQVVGAEALLRWRHPARGILAPDEFIPIAEDSRLMLPLGRWVLEEACRQAAEWHSRYGRRAPTVGVNLSPGQLEEPGFTTEVAEALQASELSPRNLVLELTETTLTRDVEAVTHTLRQLKRLWVRIAVDDFGTGYSSLQHLRRFPIDLLKIAREFVDGVATEPDDAAIARAIIDLGQSFGLAVVAEGIEDEGQLCRLLDFGCRLGQGFHFARPMEPAVLEQLIAPPPRGSRSAGTAPAPAPC